jgi:hypothetical protein
VVKSPVGELSKGQNVHEQNVMGRVYHRPS